MRFSWWGSVILLGSAGAGVVSGCGQRPGALPPEREPSLAAQIELVREGKLDVIQLEQTPLGDDDLRRLAGLSGLRSLLVDIQRGNSNDAHGWFQKIF